MLDADIGLRRGALELHVHLRAGEAGVVALLGPNGAGKTTILRVLAGLQPPACGRIVLDGTVLDDVRTGVRVAAEHRRVGVVFQDHCLFPHLSVLDNVAFGPRSRGVDRAEARRRAARWLDLLELSGMADDRPRALSGGQAQRVALARALVTEPRLLLLDEPLASVDASAKVGLRRALRTHLDAHRGVRILVTHDPIEAATLAERVVVVEAGRVVQEGTYGEVTARPRSAWVAGLGGLNLVRGEASQGVLRLDGGVELIVVGEVRGAAMATIHPRAIALHREQPSGSPRNVLRGMVGSVDRQGERWRVELSTPVPLVAEVTEGAVMDLRLGAGGEIFAAIKSTEIDVYSA
ncbi:MAG: sulfate/molybdate ABC transporter ATP-binding protein [Candidatus Dormibacteria bacterium]